MTNWQQAGAHTPGSAADDEARKRVVTQEIEVLATESQQDAELCLLVIASYPAYAGALRELLRADRRLIEIAHDGLQGLRLADLIRPDIVLCDLELRGIPGAFAVAGALRSDPSLEHLYLVGVTDREVAACQEYAIQSGFDEVIQKAADVAPIEALIRRRGLQET